MHKRERHTICGSKMGKGRVSSGFNYEKRYTYRLGHESGVSSAFKCEKLWGWTYILGYENGVSSGLKCEKGNGRTSWDTKTE